MAKTAVTSVSDYIAAQPPASQRILQRVRTIIRKTLPQAEEAISYSIPAFKIDGRVVIFFAAWKEHYSLYPATGAVATTFKDALAGYKVSKGTIRFPLSAPVPTHLIAGIARLRAKETAERVKAKAKTTTRKTAARRPAKTTTRRAKTR